MKITKLIIGIISIVLSVFIMFQSCAAGIVNSLSTSSDSSGTAGLFVAMMMMIGGIVGLMTRNSNGKIGPRTTAGFYLAGALIGVLMAGVFKDLYVWSFLAWAFGVVYMVDGFYDYPEGSLKWWQKPWTLILATIFIPPLGIVLIWVSGKFKLSGKISSTILYGLAFLIMVGSFQSTDTTAPVDASIEQKTSLAQEENLDIDSTPNNQSKSAKTYDLGENWVVDNEFSLTFKAVNLTDDRNQFSDETPEQVVLLTYDYENLGVEKDFMDLYISSGDFNVIDGGGVVASTYPASTVGSPQETPIGAKCMDAQCAYGLKTASNEITVNVSIYGNGFKSHEAVFKLPVQ